MARDRIYDILNQSTDFKGRESLLKEYLVSQVERYDRADEDPKEIAYEITGLMGTRALIGLPRENPFMEVLEMAGQLELPYPHRSPEDNWEAFKALVSQLP